MDPILAGMTISILRWEEADNVIDFMKARERQRQKRAAAWLRNRTRPMPPEAA